MAGVAPLIWQVWLELDALLRGLPAVNGSHAALLKLAPAELLSLLPPPPRAGWPPSFALQRVTEELRRQTYRRRVASYLEYPEEAPAAADGGASGGAAADDAEPLQQLPESYPARRRAQRLSYAIWTAVGAEGVLSRRFKWGVAHLQPLLLAPSTSDRLRMALLRMRELARGSTREDGMGGSWP